MFIRKFIIGFALLVLLLSLEMTATAVMKFDFNCTGTGATLSSYSYLREQSTEDSGYTRGMRTGSVNYLENGTIKYDEEFIYKYGNSTPKANSSLVHKMNVDFEGDKSISEFYGQGFFKNNRALSAWKKIRYDLIDPKYNVTDRQGNVILSTRTSKKIKVGASVEMNMAYGAKYNMTYGAEVWDGVLDARDSSGWTNKSVAQRVDWQYSSLSRGDYFKIHNNLSDFQLYYTLAPPEEWLPCCFDGALPRTDNPEGTKTGVLAPAKLLPQVNETCYLKCRDRCVRANCSPENADCRTQCENVCMSSCQEGCKNLSCNAKSCQGFDCIYTYDEGVSLPLGTLPQAPMIYVHGSIDNDTDEITDVQFEEGRPEKARRVNYTIWVKNLGDYAIEGVMLDISFGKGIMPEPRVAGYSPDAITPLHEELGDMPPRVEIKKKYSAYIRVEGQNPPIDARDIGAVAKGNLPNGPEVSGSLTIGYALSTEQRGASPGY
jgi:hypothetical protein